VRRVRERIRERCAGTLLAVLAERRRPWEPVESAWQLEPAEIDGGQRRLLDHARRFSEVMRAPHSSTTSHSPEPVRTMSARSTTRAPGAVDGGAGGRPERLVTAELWVLLGEIASRHSVRTWAFVEATLSERLPTKVPR
jgi:hypothetical protein